MSHRSDALTLSKFLRRYLGQQNILTVSRDLIVDLEHDIPAALLISQLVYWHDRGSDDEFWVYKTYKQWEEEIALSEYQVRRATKKLKGAPYEFVETKLRKVNGAPVLHYRLDLDKLSEWILEKLKERERTNSGDDPEETQGSLHTETTTETTQRNDESVDPMQKHFARLEEIQRMTAEERQRRRNRGL